MSTINWYGQSGRHFLCELYELAWTEFNPVSAVYILSRVSTLLPNGGSQHTALYVGETESLVDRLNSGTVNHDGLKRALKAGATHVGIYRIDDPVQRVAIETDLRHSLDPICNRQSVPTLLGDLLTKA
ncbi:hypothetical protein [Devosia marina]|uniref:Uncharacterized protein n=1 Tax=Devosia marina TaxID=2683198 RepID=A0A7X3FS35_9HYPH|nr:hypothetical protein [Devosia marina]MVS99257.1 hypothetical protein [Devosia marina]